MSSCWVAGPLMLHCTDDAQLGWNNCLQFAHLVPILWLSCMYEQICIQVLFTPDTEQEPGSEFIHMSVIEGGLKIDLLYTYTGHRLSLNYRQYNWGLSLWLDQCTILNSWWAKFELTSYLFSPSPPSFTNSLFTQILLCVHFYREKGATVVALNRSMWTRLEEESLRHPMSWVHVHVHVYSCAYGLLFCISAKLNCTLSSNSVIFNIHMYKCSHVHVSPSRPALALYDEEEECFAIMLLPCPPSPCWGSHLIKYHILPHKWWLSARGCNRTLNSGYTPGAGHWRLKLSPARTVSHGSNLISHNIVTWYEYTVVQVYM